MAESDNKATFFRYQFIIKETLNRWWIENKIPINFIYCRVNHVIRKGSTVRDYLDTIIIIN